MSINKFEILYQDDNIIAIQKPFGFHVHRPESNGQKVPQRRIVLGMLRDQIGKYLFPVHRLDVPTTGVLIFALNQGAASEIGFQFQNHLVIKKYIALVRGYMPDEIQIDKPLELDSTGELVPALTFVKCLARTELDFPSGKFQTSRYSLVEAWPKSGRFHQIRRHLNRISHPIIGDSDHGDSRHNRYFREQLKISGLCLHCENIKFEAFGKKYDLSAIPPRKWKKIFQLFYI